MALSPRVWLLIGSLGVLSATALASSVQPPAPSFTGTATPMNDGDMATARIRFESGARTYWHVHERGQLLLAESGRGRMQTQGGKPEELVPGRPVFAPGGVAHWHGAAPDQALTLAAVNFGGIKWLGPVSDDEYVGRKP